jgi:hypothetical protein
MDDEGKKLTVGIIGTGSMAMHLIEALAGVGGSPPAKITDPVTAPPVVSGPHGRAWLCDLAATRKVLNIKPESDGTLANWVVEAPWAHPCWHSYALILVHLRPLLDRRETLLYLDGATHELWLYAVDPGKDRNKLLIGKERNMYLQPLNFAAQFIETSDDLALARVRVAVQEICNGDLCPDTDFIRDWARRFGDNMLKDRHNPRPPRRA